MLFTQNSCCGIICKQSLRQLYSCLWGAVSRQPNRNVRQTARNTNLVNIFKSTVQIMILSRIVVYVELIPTIMPLLYFYLFKAVYKGEALFHLWLPCIIHSQTTLGTLFSQLWPWRSRVARPFTELLHITYTHKKIIWIIITSHQSRILLLFWFPHPWTKFVVFCFVF